MANMEFWGVDVKAKQPSKVSLEEGHVIHLSQATLSEIKKDSEPVTIHAKVGDQKLVLGFLSQNTPQLMFDLVFDTDFEISHNWKNGSIHLLGYKSLMNDDDDDMFSDDSDEENIPVLTGQNGNLHGPTPVAPVAAVKPKVDAKSAKDNKPKPEETDDSDEDDSDDDDDSNDEDDSDEDMLGKTDDSDDDDDEDEDDDEDDSESEDEKPAKSASGKKRANADAKTPESKKAKLVTPQKTDGKKGVHTATPHPSKKGGKSPGGDKSTPKSGGQLSCTPCKKTFNSDGALQSHNKAKHSAK